MSEVIIMVKKISDAVSKNQNPYQEITDEKNKTHRNFDPSRNEWIKAHLNEYIVLVKEKAKTGNFMNIADMREYTGEIPPGGTQGSSFSSDPVKNASIEGQVAAMEVGQNLRVGTVEIPAHVLECYWGWCESKLTRVSPPVSVVSGAEQLPATTKSPAPSPTKDKTTNKKGASTKDTTDPSSSTKEGKPTEDQPTESQLAEEKHALQMQTTKLGANPATKEQQARVIELTKLLPGRASVIIKQQKWLVTTAGELTRDMARHLIDTMEKELPKQPTEGEKPKEEAPEEEVPGEETP